MAQFRDIDLPAGVALRVNGDLTIPSNTLVVGGTISEGGSLLSVKYLGIGSTAADSAKLGGVLAANYLRADADDTTSGSLIINGTTKIAGAFYAGTVAPTNTNRLNLDGVLYATQIYDGATRVALSTRSIIAGSGLTGGGNLTADRAFAISWGGNGSAVTASRSDHQHDTKYTKRVILDGQLQVTSYRRSVIALCEVTNINPSANSFSIGTIAFHRGNGLNGAVTAIVNIEKKYNTTSVNYHGLSMGLNSNWVRPCTFTYNGIKYGGVEVFFSAAELSLVEFNGVTNFGIFGLDYYDTQTSTAVITEVNSSLNFTTDVNLIESMHFNNHQVWNEANFNPSNKVDNTVQVIAGNGLIGGGSLTGNTALAVDFAGTGAALTVSRSDHHHNTSYLGLTAKAADSDKLDNLDSTQFVRADTDFVATGTIRAKSIGNDVNGTYIPFPYGGSYQTTTTTVTGAMKITLPQSWTNTMLRFAIDVYIYNTNESFTINVGGYNYSSSSSWINPTAYIVGNNTNRDFTIRFGHDGTKCCIYVGELSQTWSYPQIVVRDFYAGYGSNSFTQWDEGWAIGFATAFGTITQTVSDCMVKSSYAKNAGLLNGQAASYYAVASHTHAGVYLPVTGVAADSSKLGNVLAAEYIKRDGSVVMTGKISLNGLNNGLSFERYVGTILFGTAGQSISNEKADILISGPFQGYIDVAISSSYWYGNANGGMTKRFYLHMTATGTIHANESQIIDAGGPFVDHFTIGNITWDATISKYKIQVVHRSSTNNPVYITVSGKVIDAPSFPAIDGINLGSIYTTDTTVFPVPTQQIRNNATTIAGNIVYHAGNFVPTQYVKNDTAGQQVTGDFSIVGNSTLFIGTAGTNSGSLILKGAGANKIQITGANTTKDAAATVYINALGNAEFSGTLKASAISVTNDSMVTNLNAEKLAGKVEADFAKTASILESSGYGVLSGLTVSAQTTPNLSVRVSQGIVYTDTGRRYAVIQTDQAITPASTTYSRWDIIFIYGSKNAAGGVSGALEGTIGYKEGTASATPTDPAIPAGAIKLARVVLAASQGTVQTANITNLTEWKHFVYDGAGFHVRRQPLSIESNITSDSTAVTVTKPIKGTGWAKSNTIPVGSRNIRWDHNLGLGTAYTVYLSCNVPNRHIYWENKLTNSIVLWIDDVSDVEVIIDAVIVAV